MIDKKRDRGSGKELDTVGRAIVRASASNEVEGEAAAASPFLYARFRARIAAEREQREERESWLAILGVVWRAIPAMAMVSILAVALFLSASFGTGTQVFNEDMDAPDVGVESIVSADNRALSSDEVLATILNEDEQEASR
jgi:hypothetical protein